MTEREEMEEEEQPSKFGVGRSYLPIYNGREDLVRYLAQYMLACATNNEVLRANFLCLLPMALVNTMTKWFFNMEIVDRTTWDELERSFTKVFDIDKLLDIPIIKLRNI